ncbi:MAG: hypothetical protein FWE90_06230 [Defluviitaleaceae bacterium]|nr:hypothetical protein [Defluviitaleaceae bacterium]
MSEMILQVKILPEPLLKLINTEKVKVRREHGEIRLIPIEAKVKKNNILPILGMYSDGKLTVENYLKQKRIDRELER